VDKETLELILTNLHDERQAAYLYARLEETETGKAGALFGQLRIESEKQAAIWERELRKNGGTVPPWRPDLRTRLVAWLLARLGPRRMLPVLSAMKVRGLMIYRAGGIADDAAPAGDAPLVAEESWHRATSGGGALRAAVFGVNDGLVSNASLIIGVAGANPDPRFILLAGVAGLLGGGLSMAAGEYVSVRTQREFLEHQIALERSEMALMPEEEIAEMALIYRTKGLEPAQAEALARRIVSDPEKGLETLAREELGLDPRALASPATAAVASFFSFVGGAFIPLAPYLATRGETAFFATLAVTLVSLLAIGALMTLFTGRRPLPSALRMALLGTLAAGATYAIGALLGVVVG
jgi:VIT1/CCC1 family predicted Fe2+/Mn2+ transporter